MSAGMVSTTASQQKLLREEFATLLNWTRAGRSLFKRHNEKQKTSIFNPKIFNPNDAGLRFKDFIRHGHVASRGMQTA